MSDEALLNTGAPLVSPTETAEPATDAPTTYTAEQVSAIVKHRLRNKGPQSAPTGAPITDDPIARFEADEARFRQLAPQTPGRQGAAPTGTKLEQLMEVYLGTVLAAAMPKPEAPAARVLSAAEKLSIGSVDDLLKFSPADRAAVVAKHTSQLSAMNFPPAVLEREADARANREIAGIMAIKLANVKIKP